MRYAALHSILQNRMQVVASASALRNTWIPPGGEYGKTRSSNIETAKHLDFSKSVSDKTIWVSLAHGCSNNLRQKSYLHFWHKKYYEHKKFLGGQALGVCLKWLKTCFLHISKFFNIISRIIFFPECTVGFLNSLPVTDQRDPADRSIKQLLFSNHIYRHIALTGYDLETGHLNGIRRKIFSLQSHNGFIICLFLPLSGRKTRNSRWGGQCCGTTYERQRCIYYRIYLPDGWRCNSILLLRNVKTREIEKIKKSDMSSRENDKKVGIPSVFLYLLTVIRVHSICPVI